MACLRLACGLTIFLPSECSGGIYELGLHAQLQVATSGIDVMVFHPSPVASRFASSADHKIAILDFFNNFAVSPEVLPDAMFAAVGRCIWRDYGMVALCFRMLSKVMDYNLLAWITAATIHTTPDYKRHAAL